MQAKTKIRTHRGGAKRRDSTTVAVYRALASRPSEQLAADPSSHGSAAWQMLLSEQPLGAHSPEQARWRGRVDAAAFRSRYSDPHCYARYQPAAEPGRTLFAKLEENRVESLGARQYAGVWANLAALAQETWLRARPEAVIRTAGSAWIETFALLTRVPLRAPLPACARAVLADRWRSWMTFQEARQVELLVGVIADQDAFARQALRVIEEVLGPARGVPQISSAPDDSTAQQSAVDQGSQHTTAAPLAGEPVRRDRMANKEPLHNGADRLAESNSRTTSPYHVYTTVYDSIVLASDLYDAGTLARRRGELDRIIGSRLSRIARWAHRLQRKLLSSQMRWWRFDCEEGQLDVSRLTRVATHPLEPLMYIQESEIEFLDTVVTLLIDNSGSMRGAPITTATVCAELLGRVLERCAVKTEILGYTTGAWRGGRAYQRWVQAGRPADPGRTSELRHIIYKSADEPWRRARARMGTMLEYGLLKENVDGEALLWAYGRLRRRTEPRKILVVISDGAPR